MGDVLIMVMSESIEFGLLFGHLLDDVALSLLEYQSALAAVIRREVLVKLLSQHSSTRTKLAEELAAAEDVAIDDPERLEIVLHHIHLPKLDDEQFVEYDARTGDIILWKNAKTIKSLLDSPE